MVRFQSCAFPPPKWVSKLVILIHFMTIYIYIKKHVFSVISIMHCVESKSIDTQCNLTLFTTHQLLYALYSNPYKKLTSRIYLFAVLDLWPVIQTVIESIFTCSCLWIKFPGRHISVYPDDLYVYNDIISSPLLSSPICWYYSISAISICPVLFLSSHDHAR